jgi:hypothetical protein
MAHPDLTELLQGAAPRPRRPLDVLETERRARRRTRRRHGGVILACVVVVASLVGLAGRLPDSAKTLVAGPASSRRLPIESAGGRATVQVHMLDGTRLRLVMPDAVGRGLAGMTLADMELHGSLIADPGGPDRPPRGWRIDVAVGSVDRLLPGAVPLAVPASSRASAAVLDRPGRRLGLQFGPWAMVVSGESLTDADAADLLAGVALVETPDGFVEYRGPFSLWLIDDADVRLGRGQGVVSLFLDDACPVTATPRQTAGGLDSYRTVHSGGPGEGVELCDRVDRLRVDLHAERPLSDRELDGVRIDVLSVGSTLAAIQRGEHP